MQERKLEKSLKKSIAMDYRELKILLNSYYNGQTTLDEERVIRNFFKKDDIPSELLEEKEMFESYKKIKKESEPNSELNNEIVNLIDHKWEESAKKRLQNIIRFSISAAAGILVILSVNFYFNQKPGNIQDTFTDEQEAYEATKEVLMYISNTMNSESAKLSGLTKINENFKSIDKLKKLDQALNNYKSE